MSVFIQSSWICWLWWESQVWSEQGSHLCQCVLTSIFLVGWRWRNHSQVWAEISPMLGGCLFPIEDEFWSHDAGAESLRVWFELVLFLLSMLSLFFTPEIRNSESGWRQSRHSSQAEACVGGDSSTPVRVPDYTPCLTSMNPLNGCLCPIWMPSWVRTDSNTLSSHHKYTLSSAMTAFSLCGAGQ